METEILEMVEMELKYCERCGGLWLRRRGELEVYCAACLPRMGEMAVWRPRRRWGRPVMNLEGQGRTSFLVMGEGGEA